MTENLSVESAQLNCTGRYESCHNLSLSLQLHPQSASSAARVISQDSPHLCYRPHLHLVCCNQATYKNPSSTLSHCQTVFALMLRTPDLLPGLITRCRPVSSQTSPHTPVPRLDFKVSTSFCPAFTRLSESLAVDPVPVLVIESACPTLCDPSGI